ncbi:hypothetical protein CPB84DRAFT_1780974 [Gymnopilus junonius]|uniref:Translation initiation factor 3 N-terminal domain-containing protein n=1 Tax=Gymnopilus junonius TaxID=109634 RepID=A0A9P5NP59_GYMJU|nr:hypothetical protein CPB84DRAFT_1780974 [Gymnopilus junonius]
MSTFLAFRSAAVSLSRPRRILKLNVLPLLVRGMKEKRKYPKNHQIEQEIVQLKDKDGTLHHAQKLSKILEDVDLSTHIVRLVSPHPPIVQIFSIMEDKMKQLEHKATKKVERQKRHIVNKEAQLSWFTAGQDLEHKLSKIREDLEKGDVRVDVFFNPKAKVRNPTPLEMTEQLDEAAKRMEGVGVEWREREFTRGIARISFQSTVKKEKLLPTEEEVRKLAQEEVERRKKQALRKKQKEEEKLGSGGPTST